jgi:hypothetical protein
LIELIYNQQTENEEFISTYEIAVGDELFQKEIGEKVFQFLLKNNPLVKKEFDKKVNQIQHKKELIEETKVKLKETQ